MIRKLVLGMWIASFVLFGLLAQAGAHLLALPSPAAEVGAAGDSLELFAERGAHAVGVRRFATDEAPIPVTLWYPAIEPAPGAASLTYSYALSVLAPGSAIALAAYEGQATPGAKPSLSDGPYPLVLLSPGFAISSASYAWLAEHLASHGFVVAAPQHQESLDPGGLWQSTIARPHDVLNVFAYIDTQVQPAGDFEGLIDNETVAVIGHSYGGYTALAAAGAQMDTSTFSAACETAYQSGDPLVFLCDALMPRLEDMAVLAGLGSIPPGLWPARSDPRVDAVVAMAGDAAMFGQAGLSKVSVPLMVIGGTADRDSPFMWGTRLAYQHTSSPHKVEIALEGAEHMIFAGECDAVRRILRLVSIGFCSDPAWDRERAHDLIEHYTAAFLLATLKQDQEAAAILGSDRAGFSGVTYQVKGY